MTRQEKLVLLLVVFVLLGKFGMLGRDIVFARLYGGSEVPFQDREYWELLAYLLGSAVNIGSAIWLFIEAKAVGLKAVLWAIFGLVFGLMGVALFYLIQLYVPRRRSGVEVGGSET